jgi:hypothetical protein
MAQTDKLISYKGKGISDICCNRSCVQGSVRMSPLPTEVTSIIKARQILCHICPLLYESRCASSLLPSNSLYHLRPALSSFALDDVPSTIT